MAKDNDPVTNPQPTPDDVELPGMPTMEQIVASLEHEVAQADTDIAAGTAEIKAARTKVAQGRERKAKAERLLKATQPRGKK